MSSERVSGNNKKRGNFILGIFYEKLKIVTTKLWRQFLMSQHNFYFGFNKKITAGACVFLGEEWGL